MVFRPDEAGRERALDDLSDGQRLLFHLAMTAATLDVEAGIVVDPAGAGFQAGGVPLPALTLIAIEEPENNLAPFYLSRIVRQIQDLTKSPQAQAVVSSHSPSILARVNPTQVRHFRLNPHFERLASVRSTSPSVRKRHRNSSARQCGHTPNSISRASSCWVKVRPRRSFFPASPKRWASTSIGLSSRSFR